MKPITIGVLCCRRLSRLARTRVPAGTFAATTFLRPMMTSAPGGTMDFSSRKRNVDKDKDNADAHKNNNSKKNTTTEVGIATATPTTATATAGEIIDFLRAHRAHLLAATFECPPECHAIVERRLPWTELGRVVHRLGLDVPFSFHGSSTWAPLPEGNEHDLGRWVLPDGTRVPPEEREFKNNNNWVPDKRDLSGWIPNERELGAWVNAYIGWEYTADQRFRIGKMAITTLHSSLIKRVSKLLLARMNTTATRFDLPLLELSYGTSAKLKNMPVSPGSKTLSIRKPEPDGGLTPNIDAPPTLVLEVGFFHPLPDDQCKAYICYGKANAVLAINIPPMNALSRLRVLDPATVQVGIKLFRIHAGNDGVAYPERVLNCKDIPATAAKGRVDTQLGLTLHDAYPNRSLPEGLRAQALPVNVTYGDIWRTVKAAWAAQRKDDLDKDGKEGQGSMPTGREVIVGGKLMRMK